VFLSFWVGSAPTFVLESLRPGSDEEPKASSDILFPIGFRTPLDSGVLLGLGVRRTMVQKTKKHSITQDSQELPLAGLYPCS